MDAVTDEGRARAWFQRRGFSALLEGTSMAGAVDTKAKLMVITFLLVMLLVVPTTGANPVGSAAVGLGIVLVTWVVSNLARRRRPLSRVVVGRAEQAVFVLVPTAAMAIAPQLELRMDEWVISASEVALYAAIVICVQQLFLLLIIGLLVRNGIAGVFPWLSRQVATSFVAGGAVLGRTIPLLLGVVGLLYFTAELWQTVGRLASWGYLTLLLLFMGFSWAFLHSRQQLDLDALARFADADELAYQLQDTPLADVSAVRVPATCPLTKRHEKDLRLVATISRLTVVTVIVLAVFAFFVLLGTITINAGVVKSWTTVDPEVLWRWETSRHLYTITWEHLRVSGFLAVFAGFYFSVVSRTDPAIREGLRDTAEETVREACAARLVALARFPARTPRVPDAPASA